MSDDEIDCNSDFWPPLNQPDTRRGPEQPKTPDSTLVSALRKLANDIKSPEGLAEGVLREAADRIEAFVRSIEFIRDAVLHQRDAMAENGMTNDQVNDVLSIIDEYDARVR